MTAPDRGAAPSNESPAEEPVERQTIEGERGIPSVNRIRSMQSRVTSLLAIGFAALVATGLLAWYYTHVWGGNSGADVRAVREHAQGEMKLPPLGRFHLPRRPSTSSASRPPAKTSTLWGLPPPLPALPPAESTSLGVSERGRYMASSATTAQPSKSLDRRLTGPVASSSAASFTSASDRSEAAIEPATARRSRELSGNLSPGSAGSSDLGHALQPTATPAVAAQVLPTQRLLLPKGSFVDCTLETAIDSSLPGLATCITATDVFGADGTTVLLERGTKLTGETQGEARRGLVRIFVLWTQARSPAGVVAALDSPGTDELGRSGLPGQVKRHFFERFGAAMLVSVIEAAIERTTRSERGGNIILNPSATQSVATEVLKSTVNIPNTLIKPHGERIQVLVARDVDFRSVYELRPAAAPR